MKDKETPIDELLKIAESGQESKTYKLTDVEKYIKKYQITDGDSFVPGFMIFHHYRQWRKRKYMSKVGFFRQFAKHFKSARRAFEKGYMLNPEPYDLTREGYFKARAFLRKERDARKKEKKESKS